MKNTVKRTNLFLIELILNLLIFVLCAAVCVGLLVHAHSLSRESTELTGAVYAAQAAAAEWQWNSLSPDTGWQAGTDGAEYVKYLDGNWQPLSSADASSEDGRFRLSINEIPVENEWLISAEISITRAGASGQGEALIYTLAVSAARGVTAP